MTLEQYTDNNSYIRFDWAMKRMLRQKANFEILEGLLTTLLNEEIKIQHLLESESNREEEENKSNRVDILAQDSRGQLIIIEVQNALESAYFQRILFGTSKLVTEYINSGQDYEHVRKVISVNIVYFELGTGEDYIYHGKTEFRGIHKGDLLRLTRFQLQRYQVSEVSKLFPEYYILKVNGFDQVAATPLEEWISFLKTGRISPDATAPGLSAARHHLALHNMSPEERRAYNRHLDNRAINSDVITTSRELGRFEGREEGLAKGREEGLVEGRAEGEKEGATQKARQIAAQMLHDGLPPQVIAKYTGLTEEEIKSIQPTAG